jgi:quercetin dioxygenase-like cupin family protein
MAEKDAPYHSRPAAPKPDPMLPLEMVAAPLSLLIPPVEPAPDLFARIATAAGIEPDLPDFHVTRADDTGWKTVARGVRTRILADHNPDGRRSMLMRMDPGAELPEHHHDADEDCYIIEGAFNMRGKSYRSGDFLVARKGSLHPLVTSPTGCLLLLSIAPH